MQHTQTKTHRKRIYQDACLHKLFTSRIPSSVASIVNIFTKTFSSDFTKPSSLQFNRRYNIVFYLTNRQTHNTTPHHFIITYKFNTYIYTYILNNLVKISDVPPVGLNKYAPLPSPNDSLFSTLSLSMPLHNWLPHISPVATIYTASGQMLGISNASVSVPLVPNHLAISFCKYDVYIIQ